MNSLAKVLSHYHIELSSTKQKIICPFHGDVNASLLVDGEKWFCFGCQIGGDAFSFHKEYQNKLKNKNDMDILIKYNSILKEKSKSNNKLEITSETVKDKEYYKQKLIEAKDFYYGLKKVDWKDSDLEVAMYMEFRGFKSDTLNQAKAKYTYSESYPIVFPIMDNGKFKGWVSRTVDRELQKKRKYLYNTGFRRRYVLAGDYNSKTVMLVEGYMDKLKANQFGIKNVAAILGWSITNWQIEKLKDAGVKTVIAALDNDSCGKKGNDILRKNFEVIDFPYPKNKKDIGEMTEKEFDKAKKKIKTKLRKLEEK